MRYDLIIVGTCVCMIGCSSVKHPAVHPLGYSQTYRMNAGEVWSRAVEWFSRNGMPVGVNKGTGKYIATEFDLNASHEDYCDCGGSKERQRVVGNLSVAIQSRGDSTRVTVAATYRASSTSQSVPVSAWTCNSTGSLEQSLLTFIGTP